MGALESLWTGFAAAGAALWLCVLALPWQPWRVREALEPAPGAADLAGVTALIPARDEAAVSAAPSPRSPARAGACARS